MTNASFIYVISGDHGRQKIGVSDDPKKRIKQLQTGSPFQLKFEFIGLTDGGGHTIEDEAHILLDQYRGAGEWFAVPPEAAITAVLAASRRLGRLVKPVDPDNLPTLWMLRLRSMPRWVYWSIAAFCAIPALLVFIMTGHIITAGIVALAVTKVTHYTLQRLAFVMPS